jgi:hypothetical protein
MRYLLASLCLACAVEANAVLVSDTRAPSVGGSAIRIEATPVFDFPVPLTAGTEVVFETRNRSESADPVLHLLGPVSGNGEVREVARDDDGAGDRNARITFTPAASGMYILLLRATWNGRDGTTDLYRDGRLFWGPLPVGGAFQRMENVRAREVLTTVPLPRGPLEHTLYVLDARGGMVERHVAGASRSAVRRAKSARNVEIAMVASAWPNIGGPLSLIRNDVALSGHDADRDGVGTELEKHIGTCSSLVGPAMNFECSRATDARDTDGDGLSDAVEIFGKIDAAPYQLLPRWGSDPRHKDVFLEVDFMARSRDENSFPMSPVVARQVAEAYGDPETDPVLRLLHAQMLGNPDLEPGIRLHFDIGLSPRPDDSDANQTLYGDWGGHNRVPPVCNADDCDGANAGAVWRQQMHAHRHGLFHYVLGFPSDAGSAPPHVVAAPIPVNNVTNMAHELGHTLGLGHNGPYDVDPIDTNCKPTYPSLMNYAYQTRGWRRFADGYGRPVLNNTRLNERNAVASPLGRNGAAYLDELRDLFGYVVDPVEGHVDWNRDGVFSAARVRAYANENGGGCEFTKYNMVQIPMRSRRAPAVARAGNMTAMFYIGTDAKIGFHYTLDSLACPAPAVYGCGTTPIQRFISENWNHDIEAFDVHRIVENGSRRFLIVYRTTDNELFEVALTTGLATGTPRRITTIAVPIDEFSLAGSDDTVYLAYKGFGGAPMFKVRTRGTWSEDELVRSADGALLPRMPAGSSPALLEATVAGEHTLFAVFPAAEGRIRLFTYDFAAHRWTRSPWTLMTRGTNACAPEPGEETSVGKPALAWTPMPPDSPLPGRLHLFYLGRCEVRRDVVRSRILTGIRNAAGGVDMRMGFPTDHQNSWYEGYGIDLLFEEGIDSNLRALISRKKGDGPEWAELRPKADGIVDFELRNWSDWEVMAVDVCRTLVRPGVDAIRCQAWRW